MTRASASINSTTAGTAKATAYMDVTSRKNAEQREEYFLKTHISSPTLMFMLYEDAGLTVASMHDM